jgi:hypothetical protein
MEDRNDISSKEPSAEIDLRDCKVIAVVVTDRSRRAQRYYEGMTESGNAGAGLWEVN